MSISQSSPQLPDQFLDPDRITLARSRRGLTKSELARQLSVTPRTITRYETGEAPTSVASELSRILQFPSAFFRKPGAPDIDVTTVNFRAARRATARVRASAVAAGALGIEVDRWISERFALPSITVPTYVGEHPVLAARLLRAEWALGTKPLPNAVQLAESRGVRVYTLPTIAEEVDAYSSWQGSTPFIFLSRRRTPERMRFDVAHELGHLVLHPAMSCDDAAQEREADSFASELLIPADAVPEYLRHNPSVSDVLQVRSQFKVSAMALCYAAHKAGRMSDWSYRQLCIELSGRGFRSTEPGGMPKHEMSRVFPQVFNQKGARETILQIAEDLAVPTSEVRALTFGVGLGAASSDADVPTASTPGEDWVGILRLV